jgi:DNA polymerase I-like protein with 3'-5' exonuclease and polymerase domains
VALAKITELTERAASGLLELSVDIETRGGQTACVGFAWTKHDALCIPLMCVERPEGYWTAEEEHALLLALRRLLTHPNTRVIGQNFLYDAQYFLRHWGFVPNFARDTMLGHHSCFSGLPKGLDYLSSLYCAEHVYWKDESKDWDPKLGEDQLWAYNCLTGDTKVLCANSIYKNLEEIQVGEALLAFEEAGSGARYARRLRVAVVTRASRAMKKVYRFDFSDGTHLRGTLDHKVISALGTDSRAEFLWKELRELKLGDHIVSLGTPWELGIEYEDAWFAGILDGEGTIGIARTDNKAYPRIGFSQKRGRVFELGCKVLSKHGFSVRVSDKSNATYVDINGGLQEQLRLLGTFGTLRIAQNFMNLCSREGASGFAGVPRPTLIKITEQEEEVVYDISTTEGTFIAGGIVVHNCKDAVITYECDEEIQGAVDKLGLREPSDFQQAMFWPVLQAMHRGVRVDVKQRSAFALELSDELAKREQYFIDLLGHPLNPKSPKQMKELFYDDLKQKPILSRKTGQITLDDEALQKIASREPLLRPLIGAISEYRSLGVFLSTFVNAQLDRDSRLRCSFNIAGTETYRLSSSQNAFGSGLNLQNIPKGGEAAGLALPNVRKLFIPDPGFTFFDGDLDRADLQVVVWEADDAELKQMLRAGVDLHIENAKALGLSDPTKAGREMAKRWVHGTNYGGGARTMAINCGLTVQRAEQMRARWFAVHPGIAEWHRRTEASLASRRYVENRFGYRRYYFDRLDGILPEALAWQPQSTVAIVVNRIWRAIYEQLPEVQVLLQVHDSLAGQYPSHLGEWAKNRIQELASSVSIPYNDPLVIPFKVKTSTTSWGDCK